MRKSPLMTTLAKGYKHKSKLLSPIKWGRLCNLVRDGKIAQAEQLLLKWKLKNGKAWLVHSLINLSSTLHDFKLIRGNIVILLSSNYDNLGQRYKVFLRTDSKKLEILSYRYYGG